MSSPKLSKYILAESHSFDPYFNLSLEKYLFDNVDDDEVIFFLWQNDKTVVCGRNQNVYKECHITNIKQIGGKIARRLSGGGAVFHDKGNLNFTFISKEENQDLDMQFEVISKACERFGIKAERSGRNDLTVDGKKISGSAFYRLNGTSYHHGTIMIDVNGETLEAVLNVNREKLKSKGVDSVRSRVTNLHDICESITVEDLRNALIDTFKEVYGVSNFTETLSLGGQSVLSGTGKGGWTSASSMLSMLKGIAENQSLFSDDSWIFNEKIDFSNTFSARFDWGQVEFCFNVKGDKITEADIFSDSLFPEFITALGEALPGTSYMYDDISSLIDSTAEKFSENADKLSADLKNLIREHI